MKRIVLLAAVAVALAACADDPHRALSRDFGNSVSVNIAAQVVNPNPTFAGAASSDGQRLGSAVDRYRTNKVYKPHLPLEGGRIYDQSNQMQQQ